MSDSASCAHQHRVAREDAALEPQPLARAQAGDVLELGVRRLALRHLEDPREPRRPRRVPRLRMPPERVHRSEAARHPPAPGERGQDGPAAGEHHRRRLPRPDRFPHREHRPARRPPQERHHAGRRPRQPPRAREEGDPARRRRRAPRARPAPTKAWSASAPRRHGPRQEHHRARARRRPRGHHRVEGVGVRAPRAARPDAPPPRQKAPHHVRHLRRHRLRQHPRPDHRHEPLSRCHDAPPWEG